MNFRINKKTFAYDQYSDNHEAFQDAEEKSNSQEESKHSNNSGEKRNSFPKWIVDILIEWLTLHRAYPYPTEEDREELLK